MATVKDTIRKSYEAAADLSGDQHKFVAIHATADTIVLAGLGARAFVLEDDPALGQAGSVALSGITKVIAAGALNAMVEITPDAAGLATTALVTHEICGLTLTSVGAANALVQILIIANGVV